MINMSFINEKDFLLKFAIKEPEIIQIIRANRLQKANFIEDKKRIINEIKLRTIKQ